MPPKAWRSNPCGGICPLRGYPRAIPQVRRCWVTALAAAGFQPSIESAAPGGKAAPTTRRGSMDKVFLLSAPVAAWAGFCWLLSSNGKVPKIARGPHGVLLFIAMFCNQANLSPLLTGQKWQNPPGETPGPPLRRIRMGLVAPHTPDRVWRLRVVPPERSPRQMPPKTWESNPCGGICPLRGIPSGLPPGQVVLGDRLGRRRLSAVD